MSNESHHVLKKHYWGVLVFLILVLLSAPNADEVWRDVATLNSAESDIAIKVNVVESENKINLKYVLPNAELKELLKRYNGTNLTEVTLGNSKLHIEMGKPAVPVIPVSLVIPPGKVIQSLTVKRAGKIKAEGYFELNHGSESVTGDLTTIPGITPRDTTIYGSNDEYPSSTHTSYTIQHKRGVAIASFNIFPVAYKPLSGKVTYFKKLFVKIKLNDAQAAADAPISVPYVDSITIQDFNVENVETLEGMITSDVMGEASDGDTMQINAIGISSSPIVNPIEHYKYIIITNQELYNSTQPYTIHNFAAKKTYDGYPAKIVTVEEIYTYYSGVDYQTKIRNFLIDAYQTWGITYVLLAGDNNVVPGRILEPEASVTFASDKYYQCIDGSYDWNANGRYGETDDGEYGGLPDLFCEFSIGRAPAATPWEMSNWVYKYANFDIAPAAGFYNNVLAVGEYLGAAFGNGIFAYSRVGLTTLLAGSSAMGINTNGLDSRYSTSVLSDYETPWTATNIITNINSNLYGQYHHIGHGNFYLLMKMVLDDERLLTNTSFPFVYSVSCKTGDFLSDCVGERLTTSERTGLLAAVLNTHNGLGYRNDDVATYDGPSHRLHRQFVDKNVEFPSMELGRVLSHSHEANAWTAQMGDISILKVIYMNILFGDPALRLPAYGKPAVIRSGYQSINDSRGNNDGIWNPHEELTMETYVTNTGSMTAYGVTATIRFTNPCFQAVNQMITIGDVAPGTGHRTSERFIINTNTCPDRVNHDYYIEYTDGTETWVQHSGVVEVFKPARFHGAVRDAITNTAVPYVTIEYSNTHAFLETINTNSTGLFDRMLIEDNTDVSLSAANYAPYDESYLLTEAGAEKIFLMNYLNPRVSIATPSFTVTTPYDEPVVLTEVLTNTGGAELSFTHVIDRSWLSISGESPTLAPGASMNVYITIDPQYVGAGTHVGNYRLGHNGPGSSPLMIPITVTVLEPSIGSTPSTINTTTPYQTPHLYTLPIENTGDGPLRLSAYFNPVISEFRIHSITSVVAAHSTGQVVVEMTGNGFAGKELASFLKIVDNDQYKQDPTILFISKIEGPYFYLPAPASYTVPFDLGDVSKDVDITVSNSGTSVATYTARSNASWLAIDSTQTETVNPGQLQVLSYTITPGTLAPGIHSTTIEFDHEGFGAPDPAVTEIRIVIPEPPQQQFKMSAVSITQGNASTISGTQFKMVQPRITSVAGSVQGAQYKIEFGNGGVELSTSIGPTPQTFTDTRDGEEYEWVQIGTQKWMAENLRWDPTGNAYENSWCYDDTPINCEMLGRLYNWETAVQGSAPTNDIPSGVQGACPAGWHIPSDTEWIEFETYVDDNNGSEHMGESLKATSGWRNGGNGIDQFGFNAIGAGLRQPNDYFDRAEEYGVWWSTTAGIGPSSIRKYVTSETDYYYSNMSSNMFAVSVRCIED